MKSLPIVGWSVLAALILALDYFSPKVDFAPLIVIPLLGLMTALPLRGAIVVAIALAFLAAVVEEVSDHRGSDPFALAANALFLAAGYGVAVLLFHVLRSLRDETREMSKAIRSLQTALPRLFPAVGGEMFGWQISLIDARQPEVRREFHQLCKDFDGYELVVGEVCAPGLNDMLVLSTFRGLLASGPEHDPVARLRSLSTHLQAIDDDRTVCRAWCAFLNINGVLEYASSGYGTTIVRRSDGSLEFSDNPPEEARERLLVLEKGDRALIAGDALIELLNAGAIALRDAVDDPDGTAEAIRSLPDSPHAFGVVVERSWIGPIERLRRTLVARS